MSCFWRDGDQIFFFSVVSRCAVGKIPIECNTLRQNHSTIRDIERKLLWIVFTYTRMQWKSLRLCPFTQTRMIFFIWHNKHADIRVWDVNWTPTRIMRFAIPLFRDQMCIYRANFHCIQRPLSIPRSTEDTFTLGNCIDRIGDGKATYASQLHFAIWIEK